MADEQFHEFHLDGKQMVFLFMASTVVAVVIFLCGVMVGRGVRANKNAETVLAAASDLADPSAVAQTTDASEAAVPTTTTATAAGTPGDSTSARVGEAVSTVPERPREAELRTPAVEAKPPSRDEPPRLSAKESRPATDVSKYREPAGSGFAVQVMTVQRLADAEAEAKKLAGRGYAPFVLPRSDGKSGFRVRVGKYKTHKEAESARTRLEKVERYKKPWVPLR